MRTRPGSIEVENMRHVTFTGGAGRHVIRDLLDHNYHVLNLDRNKLDNPRVRTILADITDSGQGFNALTIYAGAFLAKICPGAISRARGFAPLICFADQAQQRRTPCNPIGFQRPAAFGGSRAEPSPCLAVPKGLLDKRAPVPS
jgi:hypothetical protein